MSSRQSIGRFLDESALRAKARAAMASGRLPARSHDWIGGARPVGSDICAVCGWPIAHEDAAFEVGFDGSGDMAEMNVSHLHVPCFAAWEFERTHPA